ncbi:MAG: malate dehydrogenase [Rikenellaceae bacterium]|nr:malate dehydrogenase [Rikenellaceae bacterium]
MTKKNYSETIFLEALEYHRSAPIGKIAVTPTKPAATQHDLSMAYTPGVAAVSAAIYDNPAEAYTYTGKGNLVAVISNGTAVLGMGNIGALASKPVMEGKALLFKVLAGIDVFDIEVDTEDIDAFVDIVAGISPTFGGINLEDIKAPECFEIERRLKERLSIPVMHDDQHGTAIITSAALINALEISGKKAEEIKIVVNGAGAAAIACTRLYKSLGIRPENIVMCDSRGVINRKRQGLSPEKSEFVTDRNIDTLEQAMVGADMFLGVSKADILTPAMIRSMASDPIVFALANPDPEIDYLTAKKSRPDLIFATGRSDYPNQVNNVIGFPYIFRGALDSGASQINEEMKIAAAHAIAKLAKEAVPESVRKAYGITERISFSRDYLIPKPLDPRLLPKVSSAIAMAAEQSGVAKAPIRDYRLYESYLAASQRQWQKGI